MAIALKDILALLEKIIDLEAQIETAIESEKDKDRREKYTKAFRDRDLNALRTLLFD
jgi:hypothetical protein